MRSRLMTAAELLELRDQLLATQAAPAAEVVLTDECDDHGMGPADRQTATDFRLVLRGDRVAFLADGREYGHADEWPGQLDVFCPTVGGTGRNIESGYYVSGWTFRHPLTRPEIALVRLWLAQDTRYPYYPADYYVLRTTDERIEARVAAHAEQVVADRLAAERAHH